MLKYTKTILHKVSFDPSLFKKELRKAMDHLGPEDRKRLLAWCEDKFGHFCQSHSTAEVA